MTWSLSEQSDRFKIKYGKLADKVFNAGNPINMQIAKKEDFVGKQMIDDNPLGFSGSVGSGVLPKVNSGNYANSVLTSKKIYARVVVEREAMKASSTSDGAFFKFMDKPVKDALESFERNMSRMFFNDGTGILGFGDAGAADVTGLGTEVSPYIVTFATAKFNAANFEEKDFVQVVTGVNATTGLGGTAEGSDSETNLLEVVEVDEANLRIKLVGTSAILAARVAGPDPLGATDAIVMQRSYTRDMTGVRLVSRLSEAYDSGTSGLTLYGISLQRRWRMYVKDNAAAAISAATMNHMAITVEKRCGKAINIVACSYEQFAKVLDLNENQKRYPVYPANKKYSSLGFDAVEYMTTTGPVPVIPDRMIKKDEIWFLNKNYIEYRLRPGGAQWAEEDGTVFLRTLEDSYEARYACYGECFISPTYQGHLKNLAV